MLLIVLVAVEELVGALADLDDDRPAVACELRHEVQRERTIAVGDRLVLVEDQLRQERLERRPRRSAPRGGRSRSARRSRARTRARCTRRARRSRSRTCGPGRSSSSAISATLVDESTPPERNTPNGTSAIMRLRIDSRRSSRSRSLELLLGHRATSAVDARGENGVQQMLARHRPVGRDDQPLGRRAASRFPRTSSAAAGVKTNVR